MTTPADQPDLIAWLRAQLDDDERVAEAAKDAWLWNDFTDDDGSAFIERLGIDRWLAEVDAKRRILDRCGEAYREQGIYGEDGQEQLAEDVLRLLALPYADRPGYREEWRP